MSYIFKITLKGGRAGSTSLLDSSLFEERWEERALEKAQVVLPYKSHIGICRMIWAVNQIVLFNDFLSDFVEITWCVYTKTNILFNLDD